MRPLPTKEELDALTWEENTPPEPVSTEDLASELQHTLTQLDHMTQWRDQAHDALTEASIENETLKNELKKARTQRNQVLEELRDAHIKTTRQKEHCKELELLLEQSNATEHKERKRRIELEELLEETKKELDEARRLALSNNAAFSNQQAVISHLVDALKELTQ